jgi:formylglycine-generating enzyme required for sulfatase activity
MFGVQWDLVLKHLSNRGVTDSEIKNNSTWGNYSNQQFEINRGKYSQESPWNTFIDYTTATANKVEYENGISTKIGTTSTDRILLTTGASDTNSKYNIYDLAGNVDEWTLERSNNKSNPCAYRGGNCNATGSSLPASTRFSYSPGESSVIIGFRCSLY